MVISIHNVFSITREENIRIDKFYNFCKSR